MESFDYLSSYQKEREKKRTMSREEGARGRGKKRETRHRQASLSSLSSAVGPRSCTGRRRCSSARLIKRRCGAQPLISGRRLAAGRSRDIHTATTSGVDGWGSSRGRGLPTGRSVGGEEGQAAVDRARAWVRAWARAWTRAWVQVRAPVGQEGAALHSLSCFCQWATPCPFRVTKGGYHGIN